MEHSQGVSRLHGQYQLSIRLGRMAAYNQNDFIAIVWGIINIFYVTESFFCSHSSKPRLILTKLGMAKVMVKKISY